MSEENQLTEKPEVTPEEKTQIAKAMASDIMASEDGLLLGKTLNEQYRIAKMLVVSGMLPKAYKTPEQVMAGQQFARSLGLNSFVALRSIAVVNGQPSLYGDLPLGLARRTGQLEYFREFFIDEKYNEISFENKNLHAPMWGAVCTIQRKGCEKKSYTFTDIDYKRQGGGVKDIWEKYRNVMYMRKARGLALKSEFSDALEGAIIAEYDYNMVPEAGGSYNVDHSGNPVETKEERLKRFNDKLNKPDIEVEAIKGDSHGT